MRMGKISLLKLELIRSINFKAFSQFIFLQKEKRKKKKRKGKLIFEIMSLKERIKLGENV